LNFFPQDKEGILRLHSTYRHDLKTYSSDKTRCLHTAAAFLKGFLDLEGNIPPIIATMLESGENAQKLLNNTNN
jgi:inositol hexakisphosphate/diphosphoinositol-pentakisphosphate kinase